MLLQMTENLDENDPTTANTEIGVQAAMNFPARYPYDKSQPRSIKMYDTQNIRWRVLEDGYRTFKAYPKDAGSNELDTVYTMYFNLNKYMKGVETEFKEDAGGHTMATITRNGFCLCLFAEDRAHDQIANTLGSAHADKIAMPVSKWSIGAVYRLRWMDVADNLRV